jgi:hypothetical protein
VTFFLYLPECHFFERLFPFLCQGDKENDKQPPIFFCSKTEAIDYSHSIYFFFDSGFLSAVGLASAFFSAGFSGVVSVGFASVLSVPLAGSVVVASALGALATGRESVLYQPLPLNTTAGVLNCFSVRLLLHLGHAGLVLLPNGRWNSNTWLHFWHWKSKVGITSG